MLALGLTACAVEDASEPLADEDVALSVTQHAQLSTPPYEIVQATAIGNGCPAGTWSYQPIPGTNEFRADFRSLRIVLTPEERMISKECLLQFRLRTGVPVRYRITRLVTQGGTAVASNQITRHWVRASFQSATPIEASQKFTGPYEGILQLVVPSSSYAPRCASEQILNVSTGMLMTNDGVGVADAVMPVVLVHVDPIAC